MHPLILTLRLDPVSFDRLDALRAEHFPPDRNVVPAHVTLFHALPGEHEAAIRDRLRAVAADTPAIPLLFPTVRSLGKGVAVEVDAPGLRPLRDGLAKGWAGWLSPQDRQGHRPHVTVQNKVEKETARRLFERLLAEWRPWSGTGDGLLLWRYVGGPWEAVEAFAFGG